MLHSIIFVYMITVKKSRVRIPIGFFFNLLNPSSCTIALGLTQPLLEVCTRNLPEGQSTARA
jgi:hypothetical protein